VLKYTVLSRLELEIFEIIQIPYDTAFYLLQTDCNLDEATDYTIFIGLFQSRSYASVVEKAQRSVGLAFIFRGLSHALEKEISNFIFIF
jgi:hypothetical protein